MSRPPRPPVAAPTASETAVAQTKTTAEVVDSNGRKILIKKMGPLEQMRLSGIVGGEKAKNEVYFGYAVLAFSVMEIDGEIEPPANTTRELEALVDTLGMEGLEAVATGHVKHFSMGATAEPDALKN